MDFLNLYISRHSVRDYRTDMVEEEKLNKILEAGRMAPTAANRQPFRIYAVHTKGREDDLKKIYNREWFVKAPVVICVCAIPEAAWIRSDGKNYADVDCAIVMDHMILAATELGLGTCWIGAFNSTAAKEVLNMERGVEPVVFTPLGYPVQHESKKVRKNLQDLVVYK